MTPKNKRVACLLSLLLMASANAAPGAAASPAAASSASAPSPAPSSSSSPPTRPLSCAVTVSPRTLGAYTPPRVAASQPTADKVPSVISGRVDLKVVARWPEAVSAAAAAASTAVAPSSSPLLPTSSSPKSWRLELDVPADATVTWTTSNLALVGQEQGPAAKAAANAAAEAAAAVAAAVASSAAAAMTAAAPSPSSSQPGALTTLAVDPSVALGPEQAPEMMMTTMEAKAASSFAAAPAPDNAESSNDDIDEAAAAAASPFAPTSPSDEENAAAPVVTPFVGERDAAVFDVVPASASIESDEESRRLAAVRADPRSREKDPVIFEAELAAAARAAKAAAASAAAGAAASATASAPSPLTALPDALSSTRLVSYKVNASTADYEPRSASLNGVRCSVALAAGSFGGGAATASAESDGASLTSDPSATPAPTTPRSSPDLFPAGLTDPSLTPPPEATQTPPTTTTTTPPTTTTTPPPPSPTPPPAPVEQPVSTNGSQLIGVDGKPLTITGVNYFGFESGMTIVDGLWANTRDALVGDLATVVWRMKLLGVNAVRLPFSFLEFAKTPQSVVWPSCGGIDANRVRSNVIPPGVNVPSSAVPPPLPTAGNISRTPGVCNEYIKGKTSRERLLWVTKFLADNGFYVILDDHLVYDTYVLSDPVGWVKGWGALAADVAADPVMKNRVMFDLMNEPDGRGIGWTTGPGKGGYGATALFLMAMDEIYKVNPTGLFLIEGSGQPGTQMSWGDGFASDPWVVGSGQSAAPFFEAVMAKPYAANVVLSPHVYPSSVFDNHNPAVTTGPALWMRMTNSYGYLTKRGFCASADTEKKACRTFPVIFGETGSFFSAQSDLAMLEDFARYMQTADADHEKVPNMLFWCWNPDSVDTGGVVASNWLDVLWNKVAWLEKATGLSPWWRRAAADAGVVGTPPPPKIVPMPTRSRGVQPYCSDLQPSPQYSCPQHMAWGDCSKSHVLPSGKCFFTCTFGACGMCSDSAPPGSSGYASCAAVAAAGACSSVGSSCDLSCGRCCSDVAPAGTPSSKTCADLANEGKLDCASLPNNCHSSCGRCKPKGSSAPAVIPVPVPTTKPPTPTTTTPPATTTSPTVTSKPTTPAATTTPPPPPQTPKPTTPPPTTQPPPTAKPSSPPTTVPPPPLPADQAAFCSDISPSTSANCSALVAQKPTSCSSRSMVPSGRCLSTCSKGACPTCSNRTPNRSRYTCDQLAGAGKCSSLAVGTCDLSCGRCCSDVAPSNAGGKSCPTLAAEGKCASLPYNCFASCGKCKPRGSMTG